MTLNTDFRVSVFIYNRSKLRLSKSRVAGSFLFFLHDVINNEILTYPV